MYKKAKDKIKPVDLDKSDESVPGRIQDWREKVLAQEALLPLDFD